MSGTTTAGTGPGIGGGQIGALNFGSSPWGIPYTVFMPISWAWGNTSGASAPNGAYPMGADTTSWGTGITGDLLAAQQANLANVINTSLATISGQGAYNTSLVGGLFGTWANNLNSIAQQSAAALTEAVGKSAKGCSGFLSCLFG